jgi:hypothetical protein
MGLFSKILDKLGLSKKPATTATTTPKLTNAEIAKKFGAGKPAAVEVVDVMAKLEMMAKANPQKLNWKTSIVDLLKLLELPADLASLKEMAVELGCPKEKIGGDYSAMNIWLHKTVLQKIAENGGNIPADWLK